MAKLYIKSMIWNILLYILFEGLSASPVTVQFTAIGEKIQMTCPDNQSSSWQKFDTGDILASCENGNAAIKKSLFHRINVTDDCQNLTIKDFKIEDVGQYRCFVTYPDAKEPMYGFDIQIRSVTIVEANNSSEIKRREGENITLTCSIHGAQQNTVVYWTVGGTILRSNKSKYVIYQFTAKPSDHMKQFVCFANSSENSYFLEAKVQLSLIFKPDVKVVSYPSPPTVQKGHGITLVCQDESGNDEIINSFSWNQHGRLLNNNTKTLQIVRADSDVTGEYTCTVKNIAGEDCDVVNVTVTYSPVVQNYNVTFKTNDGPITLKCEAKGVPNTYKFSEWRHFTHNDQLVRTIQGYTNGTLILPHQELTYENSGIYICNVTNGIPDEDGLVWKAGKVEVIIEGIPVLVNPGKHIFIGNFDDTSSVTVFVLSSSNVLKADWFDERQMLLNTSTCSPSVTKTDFFGNLFKVPSYKCVYWIQTTKKEDFQNYTVNIENQFGEIAFNFSLVSANEMSSSGTKYIGFVLVFTFTVCILFTWWRLRKAKRQDYQRSRENEQQIQGVGVIVNNLYGSAADLHGS
ncbi:hemicentin-1-like [Mytilus californianus]|uniref:hemicentin-1-like n=1 Tax=Mytilus californianus TaxID=6549 RepID=UPI0022476032|nr:hemicentin-1-like [Mytilus californianus]